MYRRQDRRRRSRIPSRHVRPHDSRSRSRRRSPRQGRRQPQTTARPPREDIRKLPSHWKPTSDMLDYNTVYGMSLPRRVVSACSASRTLGIDNLPVHEIRLIQVLQDSSYDWCLRQVAAGKTCYLEMFRSRQEAFFSTALHRHLRDSRIDFSQVLQAVAASHNMPCDLTLWENRKMASAKLTQVVGDYMISFIGTNMTEHLTERLRNLEQENAQLRASQIHPTQHDGQESQQEAETPFDAPPADEPGTVTPCRVPNSQVHLRSPLQSGLHHKPTCWLPNHSSKMTTDPSSEMHGDPLITMEQSIYSRPGSFGGNTDLFCAAEGVSTARRSCAAIAVAHDSQIPGLPMFKRGIQMDIASAFRWHFSGRVPLGTTMSFWFMADDPTEERFRVWMLNLHRFASNGDCQRTIKGLADKGRLITKTMYAQVTGRNQTSTGVIVFFADDDIFTNVDNFWSEFSKLIEGRSISSILMNTTLENACGTLREDHPLVNAGQLIEEPGHIIYGHMFRSVEWYTLMRVYWKVYELEECEIVDRFFNGNMIATDDDIPMWAAVHSFFYYCAASTLAKIALNNSNRTRAQNKDCMSTNDCDRLAKTIKGICLTIVTKDCMQ